MRLLLVAAVAALTLLPAHALATTAAFSSDNAGCEPADLGAAFGCTVAQEGGAVVNSVRCISILPECDVSVTINVASEASTALPTLGRLWVYVTGGLFFLEACSHADVASEFACEAAVTMPARVAEGSCGHLGVTSVLYVGTGYEPVKVRTTTSNGLQVCVLNGAATVTAT